MRDPLADRKKELNESLVDIDSAKKALDIQRSFLDDSALEIRVELYLLNQREYSLPLFNQVFKRKREGI